MPYATYRFNKIIAAETIRFIVTVAIVVYKGLKLVVYRMLTNKTLKNFLVKFFITAKNIIKNPCHSKIEIMIFFIQIRLNLKIT